MDMHFQGNNTHNTTLTFPLRHLPVISWNTFLLLLIGWNRDPDTKIHRMNSEWTATKYLPNFTHSALSHCILYVHMPSVARVWFDYLSCTLV